MDIKSDATLLWSWLLAWLIACELLGSCEQKCVRLILIIVNFKFFFTFCKKEILKGSNKKI